MWADSWEKTIEFLIHTVDKILYAGIIYAGRVYNSATESKEII